MLWKRHEDPHHCNRGMHYRAPVGPWLLDHVHVGVVDVFWFTVGTFT